MEKISNEISSAYQTFTNYMKRETIGVEIGIYTVAGTLFAIAYYKIRPITKFVKPSSIPRHFIREKLPQKGVINKIEPGLAGPLVCVNHKPPINLFFASRKTLPVKISGVDINANGYSWLQSVTMNKKVKFVPLATTTEYAECQVFMLSEFKNKSDLDLADALISLGFGKVAPPTADIINENKILQRYYKHLSSTERKARRHRVGLWMTTIPPPIWPIRYFNKIIHNAIVSITPPGRRLPQLVR